MTSVRTSWYRLLVPVLVLAGTGLAQEKVPDPYQASAVAAGQYLNRVLEHDGYFIYNQDPLTGARSKEYNWLRHTGSIVALCQLYEKTSDDACRQAAKQAAVALKAQIRPVKVGDRTFTVLVDDPAVTNTEREAGLCVKTGGCALAIVALLKLDAVCQEAANQDTVLKLCEYLRFTQKPTGEPCSKLKVSTGVFIEFRSEYYPGQMLLALAMTEAKYPRPENRQAMLRLLSFLAVKWEWATTANRKKYVMFDHWGMIGLSRVYDLVGDAELGRLPGVRRLTRTGLLELAVRLCELELNQQQVKEAADPNAGSFAPNNGETTPTAIRVEGITAIANLLKRQADPRWPDTAAKWDPGIALARQFLLSCQYSAGDTQQLGLKFDAAGGFRRSRDVHQRDGSAIQIDYCQHSMSAMLEW
jgi:hypothetical protein